MFVLFEVSFLLFHKCIIIENNVCGGVLICFCLSTSLQIAGYALMREYGKQFQKVLYYICKQYIPRSVSSYSHADSF